VTNQATRARTAISSCADRFVRSPLPWRVIVATITTITTISSAAPLAGVPRLLANALFFGLALTGVGVLACAWRPIVESRPEKLTLSGLAGLVVVAALSGVMSAHRAASLSQVAVLALMLAFVMGTALVRWRSTPQLLYGDLAVSASVLAFWSLLSALVILVGVPSAIGPYSRGVGVFSNANYLGMVAAIALGLTVALALQIPWAPHRRGILAASALLVVPLALSQSRGAALAAAAGVLVTLAAARRVRAAVILLGTLAVVVSLALLASPGILDRVPVADPTSGRIELWTRLLDLWANHPVLGIGYRTLQLTPEAAGLAAHNVFLGLLVETGLLGLAFMLTALAGFMWSGRRSPLLGVVVTVLVIEQTESTMFGWAGPTALTFWLVLAAHSAWGLSQAHQAKDRTSRLRSSSTEPATE